MRIAALLALSLLAGCAHRPPGIRIVPSERVVETMRPCAARKPVRPAGPALTGNAVEDVVILGRKLLEWAGDGKYADKAEAAIDACATRD